MRPGNGWKIIWNFGAIKSGPSYDDHWLWWCFDFNQAIDAHLRIALRNAGTCLDSRAGHHCTLGHCMMLQHAHILWHNIGWDACFKLLQVWRLGPAPFTNPRHILLWPGPAPCRSIPRRILLWLGPAVLPIDVGVVSDSEVSVWRDRQHQHR